jgi:hypothetical protein
VLASPWHLSEEIGRARETSREPFRKPRRLHATIPYGPPRRDSAHLVALVIDRARGVEGANVDANIDG